jgi:hypothetical protein
MIHGIDSMHLSPVLFDKFVEFNDTIEVSSIENGQHRACATT